MRRLLFIVIAALVLVPSACVAKTTQKQPTTMKGYIKVAQKAYPGKCTGHIGVRWDIKKSKLHSCEISLQRAYWKIADREYRCMDVVLAVANLEGHHGAANAKACHA